MPIRNTDYRRWILFVSPTIFQAKESQWKHRMLNVVGLAADFFFELPLEALEGCTPVEYFDKHLPLEIAA